MRTGKRRIVSLLSASILPLCLTAFPVPRKFVIFSDDCDLGPARVQENRKVQVAANALQVARIIGVGPEVSRLSELVVRNDNPQAITSLEELSVRQAITDSVVMASLDIDSVLVEMDYERQQLEELRNILRARRDRATGTTNLAVLVASTGLGIVGGALSFNKGTEGVGNAVGFASGGISTLFSLRSYRQIHSGKRPSWVLPNMLAGFLNQPEEQHSHYPQDVWIYLNSAPVDDSGPTRRERVLAEWVADGRIARERSPQPSDTQAPDERGARWIALLTSTKAADKKLNLEVLNEREAMLADARDAVAQMKGDLADLLRGLKRR